MDSAQFGGNEKISRKDYWKWTLLLFIFSSVGYFLLDLVLAHWSNIFGTRTFSASVRHSVVMGMIVGFLLWPVRFFFGRRR